MKQYTGRPEKYEELSHTPRDTDSIAAVPGFYPASQFVFRTGFDASTGQTVEERYEEAVYCRTCHELLWSDSPRPKPIGFPQQLVHKDGSSVMMLCHACGYRAAPTPPSRLCPQCGVDRPWGDDHSAQPEPPFTTMALKFPTRVADQLEKLRAEFGDDLITEVLTTVLNTITTVKTRLQAK
jgi:hypothetical protein